MRPAAKVGIRESDYRLAESRGLYLLIRKSGSKIWAMRYYYAGTEKKLMIGFYPEISLKQAKGSRDTARAQSRAGMDPSAAKSAGRDNTSTQTSSIRSANSNRPPVSVAKAWLKNSGSIAKQPSLRPSLPQRASISGPAYQAGCMTMARS